MPQCFSFLTVALAPHAFSQSGLPLWTNRLGASALISHPYGIAVDNNSGNVFVTGYWGNAPYSIATVAYSGAGVGLWTNSYAYGAGFSATAEAAAIAIDTNNGHVYVTGFQSSVSPISGDYVTVAYSTAGARLWVEAYDGTGHGVDKAQAIAVGPGGRAIVTGTSANTTGGTDFATIAYSSSGTGIWTNRFSGPENGNAAVAVAVDRNGRVFVTGSSTNSITGSDYATVAYSSSGSQLWVNRYDGPASGNDYAKALALDAAGNVYVTGYSLGVGSTNDYATVAYSNAGTPLWTNRCDGPASQDDRAAAVAVDSAGNVFVTGYSAAANFDYATVAYSSSGVPLWTSRYNGPANGADFASAIAVDSAGNVFVTGNSAGQVNDYATVAYSNAGLLLWANRFNGPLTNDPPNNNDYATAIAVGAGGSVYVTGYSWHYEGASGIDFATIKYSSSLGAYLGIRQSSNQVVLNWTNTGFDLQSAPSISGPFTNVPNATSPLTNSVAGSQEYFRLLPK